MKAFVTGATGFIGRRLVERLLAEGWEVITLVRSGNHRLPKGVRIIQGDILFPDSLENFGMGCHRLYHLAALITFDPRRRAELLRVNGEGTGNILAAARKWRIERSLIVSSACTMGLAFTPHSILDENSSLDETLVAHNPYLAGKLLAEQAAIEAARERIVVVVNPTTVYGPGDWTLNSGALVQKIAKSAVLPIPPGGSNVVDVDDVVAGILAAGEHGQSGKRYILGGENLLFGQIFQIIAQAIGHRPLCLPVFDWMRHALEVTAWMAGRVTGSRFLTPQIVGDLFAFKYYSSKRAQQELGWSPRYSFPETIERAWKFYQQKGLIT